MLQKVVRHRLPSVVRRSPPTGVVDGLPGAGNLPSGVRDTPFFRPPVGARDGRTDRIAADLGHPTIATENGTSEDFGWSRRRS